MHYVAWMKDSGTERKLCSEGTGLAGMSIEKTVAGFLAERLGPPRHQSSLRNGDAGSPSRL